MTEKICLSAIIPTLNAARTLAAAIAALGAVAEVLVVDGGSADDTVSVAVGCGAGTIEAPRGRGSQFAAGIAAATEDWLLLLHADTRLQPGWRESAAAHMASGSARAGFFRFNVLSDDPRARRLERLVTWRCRVFALPYGDQGLLIHRDLLRAVGGIRALPLMEDVDLIRRLGRSRLAGLDAVALTSAHKWHRDGWYRRSAHNLCCLALWFAGIPPRWILRLYG